jgi:uncharacterized protein (TIGR02271 family)
MTSRKIIAVFDSREAAQSAQANLIEAGLDPERISVTDQGSSELTAQTQEHRGSFWAHVKEMFMPDNDRATLEESLRRGGCVLVASVEEARVDEAIARLETAGAVDLEQRETEWRAAGWNAGTRESATGASADAMANAQTDLRSQAPTGTPADRNFDPAAADRNFDATASDRESQPTAAARGGRESEAIPVVEEKLRIGKREVSRGGVRVRSYIVEEPVHEEVRLREERVSVERRPVDAPARPVVKGSPGDLMQERTVEVTETAEQAVVGKEARITEEVVISKEADERVEQIDDTVRRTEVEVEDGRTDQVRRKTPPRTPDRPGRP